MAVTSSRTIQIIFSGDVDLEQPFSAADNAASPGQVQVLSLSSGNNTITVPAISGVVPTGLLIIPPSANTIQMILKGTGTDAGIALHLTDPTSVAIAPSVATLVINAANTLNGVRLIWT